VLTLEVDEFFYNEEKFRNPVSKTIKYAGQCNSTSTDVNFYLFKKRSYPKITSKSGLTSVDSFVYVAGGDVDNQPMKPLGNGRILARQVVRV
jgi:hypothetical protein